MKSLLYHFIVLFVSWSSFAQSTLLWDESVNGPFGDSPQTATALGNLNIGTNTIIGEAWVIPTGPNWLIKEDLFQYNVTSSMQLNQILLTTDGAKLLVWLGESNYSTQLGYKYNAMNGDLLPQMGASTLASGPYVMYVANLDAQDYTSIAHYRLDFIVTSIPEPSTVMLLVSGGLGLFFLRWRKTCRFSDLPDKMNRRVA